MTTPKATRAPGAGRPPIHQGPLGGPTRAVSLTLPVALVERLDRIAETAVATRSYVITTLLIDHFEGD